MFTQLPMYQNAGKTAYKEDLSNTYALSKHLDNPEQKFKSVHTEMISMERGWGRLKREAESQKEKQIRNSLSKQKQVKAPKNGIQTRITVT